MFSVFGPLVAFWDAWSTLVDELLRHTRPLLIEGYDYWRCIATVYGNWGYPVQLANRFWEVSVSISSRMMSDQGVSLHFR